MEKRIRYVIPQEVMHSWELHQVFNIKTGYQVDIY